MLHIANNNFHVGCLCIIHDIEAVFVDPSWDVLLVKIWFCDFITDGDDVYSADVASLLKEVLKCD